MSDVTVLSIALAALVPLAALAGYFFGVAHQAGERAKGWQQAVARSDEIIRDLKALGARVSQCPICEDAAEPMLLRLAQHYEGK